MNRIFLSAPDMAGRERELVGEVFDSNYVAPAGAMLAQFEQNMCAYTNIGHAVALSSGTAALHLALYMLECGPGDEIWTSSMTFMGGVSPIYFTRSTPVFFDLSPESWTIDCDILEEELAAASKRGGLPKAIVPTDLYGQSCDLDRVLALGEAHDVPVITDSAEALGALYKGRHAGKGTHATILSFNGNKIITSSGGGMLLSDNKDLVDRARYLSTQARQPAVHYEHTEIGFNYRLSNVSAAIGVGQLEMIEEKVARRRAIFDRYVEAFGSTPGVSFMPEPEWSRCTRWLTCFTIEPEVCGTTTGAIYDACETAQIEVRPLWKPMHMQPAFADTRFVGPKLCEQLFKTGLCVPSGSGMTATEQERVIDVIAPLIAAG